VLPRDAQQKLRNEPETTENIVSGLHLSVTKRIKKPGNEPKQVRVWRELQLAASASADVSTGEHAANSCLFFQQSGQPSLHSAVGLGSGAASVRLS
jgi:hypothetical protein